MYLVVSRWRMNPGKEEEARSKGLEMRRKLRNWPGVESVSVARMEEGDAIVAIGYRDKATYDHLINDPGGPFARAAEETGIEGTMEWVESWRGESEPE